MILIWSLLSFAFLNSSAPPEQRLDFSCATFHPFLTESELIEKFGRENVTSGPIFGADDGPAEGTILFANRDDMKVEILWPDATRKQNPSWIRVRGERSLWQTPNGLKLGENLRAIERRNGFPFRLAGFTSESHGDLRDWGIGRLGNTPNCNIGITFQPRPGTGNPSLIRQVTSRSLVSSGHPAMQEINPQVVALWIRYPIQRSPTNADDALLDVLVFGIHMPIDPAQYPPELGAEVQQYLRRAVSYNPKRAVPSSGEMGMVYAAQIGYETRLVANSDDPKAPALAQDYVTRLRPCYEWKAFTIALSATRVSPTSIRQPILTGHSATTCRCSQHTVGCARLRVMTMKRTRRRPNAAVVCMNNGYRSHDNLKSCCCVLRRIALRRGDNAYPEGNLIRLDRIIQEYRVPHLGGWISATRVAIGPQENLGSDIRRRSRSEPNT